MRIKLYDIEINAKVFDTLDSKNYYEKYVHRVSFK